MMVPYGAHIATVLLNFCLQNGDIGANVHTGGTNPAWPNLLLRLGVAQLAERLSSPSIPTFLSTACTHGDIERARHLLESGTYHSSRDIFDGTPLIRAAQHGHREVIPLLVEHGASVAQEDLYSTCTGPRRRSIRTQLRNFSLPAETYLDSKGQTLLHLAVRSRSEETAALLSTIGQPGSSSSIKLAPLCGRTRWEPFNFVRKITILKYIRRFHSPTDAYIR